jgi:hypothetical protein
VANALDSGAATIRFHPDPAAAALTIVDDGAGMRRRDLARYHDIAATTKIRGAGIGFAGVGVKIALLTCAEVITESGVGSSTSPPPGASPRATRRRGGASRRRGSSAVAARRSVW